jgi:hypothetical protein
LIITPGFNVCYYQGGLGLKWLYTTQGIQQIIDLLTQMANDSLTGQLYHITLSSLEELVLEAGIGHMIF